MTVGKVYWDVITNPTRVNVVVGKNSGEIARKKKPLRLRGLILL
jgi:hypothetical protein